MEISKIGERIREFRQKKMLTQKEIGGKLGYSHAYISQIERGIHEPSRDLIKKFSEVFGLSSDYILYGREETAKPEHLPVPLLELVDFADITEGALRKEDFLMVPLVAGNIAASIGTGTIVDEYVEDWVIIHKKIIGKHKGLISIRVDKKDGMSMYPVLRPGDIVIIDREDIEIKSMGIYAVRIDDGCTVKKLQRTGNQLLLIPENKDPAYKVGIIDLIIHDSPVIGRAIWCSKML